MRISKSSMISFSTSPLSQKSGDRSDSVNFGAKGTSKILASKINFESISKMERLSVNLRRLEELFLKLKEVCGADRNKYARCRSEYLNYVTVGGRGWAFKIKDWLISVAKLEKHSNLVKIYARKEQDVDPHVFHIEDNKYVLANSMDTQPRKLPRINNYMSQKQISESRVEELIDVTDKEVCEYIDYLQETILYVQGHTIRRKKRTSLVNEAKSVVQEASDNTEAVPMKTEEPIRENILLKSKKTLPDVIKLSEIDDIFKELTGKTIAQVSDVRGSVSDPRRAIFSGEASTTPPTKEKVKKVKSPHSNKPTKEIGPIAKSGSKTVIDTPNMTKGFERTVLGLTKYLEENNNSFQIETANGLKFIVSKADSEGDEYLSIIKRSPVGRIYFNVDCNNEKLLKTDITGKPMLLRGVFVPYQEHELRVLKLQDEFDKAIEEIFDYLEGNGEKTKPLEPKIRMLQTEVNEAPQKEDNKAPQKEPANVPDETKEIVQEDIPAKIQKNTVSDTEDIIERVRIKAKFDAKEVANEYFKTFVAEFKLEMAKKMEEFERLKKEIFEEKR